MTTINIVQRCCSYPKCFEWVGVFETNICLTVDIFYYYNKIDRTMANL